MTQTPDNVPDSTPLPFRNHTALLLATALPFFQQPYRHPVELIIKFLELSDTMKLYREFHSENGNPFSSLFRELSHPKKENGLFGLINTFFTDIEGLLCSLSKVCTGNEQEIIGLFLNIIRAKNFYDTYGDLLNMGSFFSESAPDFSNVFHTDTPPESDTQSPPPSTGFPFSGDLSSMLNNEQQETLNLLKNLFSTE